MFKNLVKKIFNKPRHELVYTDDSFIKTAVVYNESNGCNLIIVIEISDDYAMDMVEFISCCGTLNTRFIQTSVPTDELDENKEPIQEYHNYLLIGGDIALYGKTIENTPLSNPILLEIINEIYANCNSTSFFKLIEDDILNESLFDSKDAKKDAMIEYGDYYYDSLEAIKDKLPLFDIEYLLPFVNVLHKNQYNPLNLFIKYISKNDVDAMDMCKDLFKNVLNKDQLNATYIQSLVQPLYKIINTDDDDNYKESNDLDELFTHKYDKLSNTEDADISYLDIDDEIE